MESNLLVNCFLVAMPSLADPNFSRAVIYLHEHSNEGAVGMIVNKPLQVNLGNVMEHLGIPVSKEQNQLSDQIILMGGPVGQEHGFILYDSSESTPQQKVTVSASKELLYDIAKGGGPKNFVITLGYAGWGAGQLEKEIARNDWLVAPYDSEILFHLPLNRRWPAAAALIGVDINRLSDQVGHA